MHSLLRTVDFNRVGEPTAANLESFLMGLTRTKVEELVKAGARISQVTCGKGHVVFLPCGWAAMEYTVEGGLHYGLRKQILMKSSQKYKMLTEYHEQNTPASSLVDILDSRLLFEASKLGAYT